MGLRKDVARRTEYVDSTVEWYCIEEEGERKKVDSERTESQAGRRRELNATGLVRLYRY